MIHVIPGADLPPRYDDLRDKPAQLYVRGDPEVLGMPSVAIVGSRACSSEGRIVARKWAYALAKEGLVIVSGLAHGIDGEAHRGALEAPSGLTVAVLGCGIDRNYPAMHAELAKRIETSGGAIVSEYEPGVEPAPWRFPVRNRIVAAADVTLLIEARPRSGSLITTSLALEMGRTVLAVPGDISVEGKAGSNMLLRERKAEMVLSPDDVLGWLDSLRLRSEYVS